MTIGLVFLTAADGRHRRGGCSARRSTCSRGRRRPRVHEVHGAAPSGPPAKTALWVFLGVATSLFVLFVSAYAMRLGLADWTPAAAAPAADAEHRAAGRRQPGDGVDGACRAPRRRRRRAARPVRPAACSPSASSPASWSCGSS